MVDFACTTKYQLIFEKIFVQDNIFFDDPVSFFSDLEKYFGERCKILVYAVGEDLYRRLKKRWITTDMLK